MCTSEKFFHSCVCHHRCLEWDANDSAFFIQFENDSNARIAGGKQKAGELFKGREKAFEKKNSPSNRISIETERISREI